VRTFALSIPLLLVSCGSPPAPPVTAHGDPTTERWYGDTLAELVKTSGDAKALLQQGKSDAAAALITKGESLSGRLLAVPRPTLAAAEAASDIDQLYGQMLLSNHNYGWARLTFQKNLARWKHWKPQTPETAVRLNQAKSAIAECDARLSRDP
jgi:hypothetical protein